MDLDHIIKELTKAEKLLKKSAWSSQNKRDARAVELIDQLLADPQLPSDIKIVIENSKSKIGKIKTTSGSPSPLDRTIALQSVTNAIIFVQTKALRR